MTRKWNIVNDQSNASCAAGNEIIYNTEVLKCNTFDYNNAYILVKGNVTVAAAPATQISFKNCPPFTKCITKIDGTTIDDAVHFHLVMAMYNLIDCGLNYSETTGNFWFYAKDEATNFNADISYDNDFKSIKYQAKLLGKTVTQAVPNQANWILKNAAIAVPLKYLSNFWRSFKMPVINCKIELKLTWTKYCVLSAAGNDNTNANPNNITIKETKLYVPVLTLSKLYKKRFER